MNADATSQISRVLPGSGSDRLCTGCDPRRARRAEPHAADVSSIAEPDIPTARTSRAFAPAERHARSRSVATSATAAAAACTRRATKSCSASAIEQAKLVFVGEGPGADEDAQGIPFVGRAGQLLTQMIENTAEQGRHSAQARGRLHLQRGEVPAAGEPHAEPDEMEICGQFLFRQLSVIKPKAICALGCTAAKALLGTKEGVTRLRGNWHKWRDIPVMVTYHPSYLLRPYNQNAKREAWEDLKKVLHFVYD